jgi:hypothetical protein
MVLLLPLMLPLLLLLQIYPMLLEGADPVAAAAMPDFKPSATSEGVRVTLADLYPARHPTKHIVAQYKEHEPSPLSPKEEERVIYTGPPETANANPATVVTSAPDDPTTVPLPLMLSTPADVSALAAAIAAGAGPDTAAELGSEGFTAAASWIERAQAAAAAPADALATPDGTTTDSSASTTGSSSAGNAAAVPGARGEGGRKLKQTMFNERQDILVLWTGYAADRAGSVDRIQALIRTAIVNTNKVYADSRVSIDLILVGLQRVSVRVWGGGLGFRDIPIFQQLASTRPADPLSR